MADKGNSADTQDKLMVDIEAKFAAMIEAAEKKGQEILSAASAKAEEIIANAKAAVSVKPPASGTSPEIEAWLNEPVEIKLFKDNQNYKDDVTVSINGENCRIQRGVYVKVKRKFVFILDQSELQDTKTALMIDRKVAEYEADAKKYL